MNNAVSTAIPPSRLRNYLLHAEVKDIMTDSLDEIENSVQAAMEVLEEDALLDDASDVARSVAMLRARGDLADAVRAAQD